MFRFLAGLFGSSQRWKVIWSNLGKVLLMLGIPFVGWKLEKAGTIDAAAETATKIVKAGGEVADAAGTAAKTSNALLSQPVMVYAIVGVGALLLLTRR